MRKQILLLISLVIATTAVLAYQYLPRGYIVEYCLETGAERTVYTVLGLRIYESTMETPTSIWIASLGETPARQNWVVKSGEEKTWKRDPTVYEPHVGVHRSQFILHYLQSLPPEEQKLEVFNFIQLQSLAGRNLRELEPKSEDVVNLLRANSDLDKLMRTASRSPAAKTFESI